MWKFYALLSALCAALTAIFAKIGVRDIDSSLATAIRSLFILPLVWGIALFAGSWRDMNSIQGKTWLFLLLSALATGCSWLFYFKALQLGEAAKVAPLDKLSVPLTILFAFLFLGEKLDWQTICGGLLITAGSLLLLVK